MFSKSLADKFLFCLFLALLVFIPLYPKFPLASVAGTYVAIRLDDIFIAVTVIFWFLANIGNLRDIFKEPVVKAIAIFWAIGLLTVVSGLFLSQSVTAGLGLLHWLRRIEYMSLFFVGLTTVTSLSRLKVVLATMFLVTMAVVIYGFGQIYLGFPVVSTENKEYSKGLILRLTPGARANSTFAGQYDLAAYLSFALIFLGTFFFYQGAKFYSMSKNLIWQKALLAVNGLGSLVLLTFTATRTSFMAAFVGLALSFWLTGKKVLIASLVVLGVVAIALSPQLRGRLLATLTVNLLNEGGPRYATPSPPALPTLKEATRSAQVLKPGAFSTRSATPAGLPRGIVPGEPVNLTELGVSRSYQIRLNVEWPRAVRAIEKNPVLGTGYSSLTIATDNDYLRSLGETGLLGTLSLALIFVFVLKTLWRGVGSGERFLKLFFVAMLCSVVGLLITATFVDVLEASKIATISWAFMGIALAIYRREVGTKSESS